LRFLPQQISSSAYTARSAPLIPSSAGVLGSVNPHVLHELAPDLSRLVHFGISLRSPAIRFGSSHRECCQAKILSLHELSSLNQALPKADYFSDELSASHVRTAADG
jgi:hypothetical protein